MYKVMFRYLELFLRDDRPMRRNFFVVFSVLVMSTAASAHAHDSLFHPPGFQHPFMDEFTTLPSQQFIPPEAVYEDYHLLTDEELEIAWSKTAPASYHVTPPTVSMADSLGRSSADAPPLTSRCASKHLLAIGGSNTVAEYTYDGSVLLNDNYITVTNEDGIPIDITGVAISNVGIYVYEGGINRIHILNAGELSLGQPQGGSTSRPIYDADGHIPGWTDVATDGFSHFAYNATTGQVVQTKLSGSVIRTLGASLLNYEGFAADGAYLYFYNAEDGRVRQTDLNGNTTQAVYATLPTGLIGIAIEDNLLCQPGPNLAMGRTAIQSSEYSGLSSATSAIDSNIYGHAADGSVSHTGANDSAPWWQVDLNNRFALEQLRLWNRTDCCENRLSNFHIFVSNGDMSQRSLEQLLADSAVWHYHETGTVDVEYNLSLAGASGRHVRIQKADAGYLQLAEVQVFGENLALGKRATQSTTREGGDYDASNVVDGDLTTYNETTDSHTSWFQIDLGRQVQLGQAVLESSDFFGLGNTGRYYIFVSEYDMSRRTSYDLLNDPSVWNYEGALRYSPNLRINATGRYVRFQTPDSRAVGLNELMLYGVENSIYGDAINPADMPPHIYGQWSDLIEWTNTAIHASVLPDGNVLTFDYPINAYVWDYPTGESKSLYPATRANLFCAGHATLPDGTFFATGGTKGVPPGGHNRIPANHLFNHETQEWTRTANMTYSRWYPSVTPLDTGEILLTGGRGGGVESYDYRSDTARVLTEASSYVANEFYPMLQQASDGSVFVGGPTANVSRLDPAGEGAEVAVGRRDNTHRDYGSYGVYDTDLMMVNGGGQPPVDTTMVMDMDTGAMSASGRMHYNRRNHNTTILPDGTMLTTGGFNGHGWACNAHGGITAAELWSPETGEWQVQSSMRQARSYHSTAVLLFDARVMAIGGQNGCQTHYTAEIFTPAYLFNEDGSLADRPVIASSPDQIGYNTPFQATLSGANENVSAALIRLSSVTHSTNMAQRRIELDVSQAGDRVTLDGITGPTIVQPGIYMLFVTNDDGVPSVAETIQVGVMDPLDVQTEYNFDFGTNTSPVQSGWTRVTPDSADTVVSWSGSPRWSADRGAIAGINNINRDLVYGAAASTLSLNIGSGTWNVTINMGDASNAHDQMVVKAEGETIDEGVTNEAGQFPYVTGEVIVRDGVLDLQFSDSGGDDPHWVLTRLSVTKVSDKTAPPVEEAYDFDFGTNTSPVADGWTRVTNRTYDGLVQWVKYPSAVDRGTDGIISNINRDSVTSHNPGQLKFNVGNGLWRVTMTMGDRDNGYDGIVVKAEGRTIADDVAMEAGEFKYITDGRASVTQNSFVAHVQDGVLDIEIGDGGGELPHWALTRLSLRKIYQIELD